MKASQLNRHSDFNKLIKKHTNEKLVVRFETYKLNTHLTNRMITEVQIKRTYFSNMRTL